MIETPERIWGHIDGDKGSWGRNWVFDEDVEYIRADLAEELEAKLDDTAWAVWMQFKHWDGEKKFALREVVKFLKGETT